MTPPPRPNTPRVVKEGAALGGARDHGFHRSRRPSAAGPPGDRSHVHILTEARGPPSSGALLGVVALGWSRLRPPLEALRRDSRDPWSARVVLSVADAGKDASFPLRAARKAVASRSWKPRGGRRAGAGAGRSGGGRGSLPRRFSLTTRIDSRRVTRVRGERGRAVKGERVRVCSGREAGDQSSGRRPGHDGAVVSNRKAARSGSGAAGLCGLPYGTKGGGERQERTSFTTVARQRAPEV